MSFLRCQIARHYHASALFVVSINSNSSYVNMLTALLIPLALGLGKAAEEIWHWSHLLDMIYTTNSKEELGSMMMAWTDWVVFYSGESSVDL